MSTNKHQAIASKKKKVSHTPNNALSFLSRLSSVYTAENQKPAFCFLLPVAVDDDRNQGEKKKNYQLNRQEGQKRSPNDKNASKRSQASQKRRNQAINKQAHTAFLLLRGCFFLALLGFRRFSFLVSHFSFLVSRLSRYDPSKQEDIIRDPTRRSSRSSSSMVGGD